MPKTVISVENLSKSYRLGQIGTGTLSRDLEIWLAKLRGKPNPYLKIGQEGYDQPQSSVSGPPSDLLWALQDVSFQVQQGEVLGIIGRNGAGKSTLLKILSRVTAPTSGQVKVKGRIASLLEVGTGFHPELTGRENIFLNGAILGMSKQEVQRKFDEIVNFAEVEKFVDTPVKRYSSGMYVRLAFAVAAHLESEILLVDEVLAVGDAEFQKKCLGKMGDVASNEGRTVFFVSHNMAAIQQLCPVSMFLQRGNLEDIGTSIEMVNKYLNIFKNFEHSSFDIDNPERKGNKKIVLTGGRVIDHNNNVTSSIISGNPMKLEFDYLNNDDIDDISVSLTIFNEQGIALTNTSTTLTNGNIFDIGKTGKISCLIKRVPFLAGEYRVAIALNFANHISDLIPNALTFTIESSSFFPNLKTPDKRYSLFMLDHHWNHKKNN